MGAVQRGTSLNLVQRFWTIDATTEVATLADPTTVTFRVESPEGVETDYVFGVDPNVTNPLVGVFVCELAPPLPTGTWRYRAEGTGAVEAASEEFFDILESGVLSPARPGVAVPGPCSSWINGDDVAACGAEIPGVGSDHWLLDDSAYDASFLLYAVSGRQFPGVCTRTVRPCREAHDCFSGPGGPFYWGRWGGGWGWRSDRGDRCGCGTESYVRLGGYPVREILEVKIDGAVVPSTDYRLDGRRDLIYKADPGPPVVNRFWPSCQNNALDDTEPGTFSVTYTWGTDVPPLGRAAAAALARELYLACHGGDCKLPDRVTKVVRNGVTYERVVALATMLRRGETGIKVLDAFIATANPTGMDRRPAVWSPDVRAPARKVGQ